MKCVIINLMKVMTFMKCVVTVDFNKFINFFS